MKYFVSISFLFSLILLLSCESSKSRLKNQETPKKSNQQISFFELDSIRVGLEDEFSKGHLLDTVPMSYEEFSNLKDESISPSKNSNKKGVIELPLSQDEMVFIKKPTSTRFELLGEIKKINCYILAENSVAEGIDFSELILINKDNKCRYYVTSIGDWRVSDPVGSKDGKFLAYYFNTQYNETVSFLRIMSVNKQNSKEKYLTEYALFNSENFAVREIRWINNQEIALCVYHKQKGISYYKFHLETSNN